MTVRKFRSAEELPEPTALGDALAGLAAACELSTLAADLGRPWRLPRGVRRFRSVEAADRARRDHEAAAIARGATAE